jgi:hypothetical protein
MFSKRYNELSIIIIGVLLILVAFGSQVYPAYVVLDDAIRIYENYAKDPHTIRTALAFGRPINALFLNYSYKLLPGLQNIQYIRLISVAGVCASFVILYRLLQDFFPQPGRYVISFSTVLLPPFIVVTLIGAADS